MSVLGAAEAYDPHVGRYGVRLAAGLIEVARVRPFTAGVGHSGGCFASLDGDRQAALAADAYRRLDSPDGPFELTARAWWARGTAP